MNTTVRSLNNATKVLIMGELDKIERMVVIYSHLGDEVRLAQLDESKAALESLLLDIMSEEGA
jgi:hypothetical protein